MAAECLEEILAAQGLDRRQVKEMGTPHQVFSLFVLRFCARPLAGPPVGRTDSAIAPSPQVSADHIIRRETFEAHRCNDQSQPR